MNHTIFSIFLQECTSFAALSALRRLRNKDSRRPLPASAGGIVPGFPAVPEGLLVVFLLQFPESQRRPVRTDRQSLSVTREAEAASGYNAAGPLVAQEPLISRQQHSHGFSAFDPGFPGSHQAAQAHQLIAFPMHAEPGIPQSRPAFPAEGTDGDTAVALDGNAGCSVLQRDFRFSTDGADSEFDELVLQVESCGTPR